MVCVKIELADVSLFIMANFAQTTCVVSYLMRDSATSYCVHVNNISPINYLMHMQEHIQKHTHTHNFLLLFFLLHFAYKYRLRRLINEDESRSHFTDYNRYYVYTAYIYSTTLIKTPSKCVFYFLFFSIELLLVLFFPSCYLNTY